MYFGCLISQREQLDYAGVNPTSKYMFSLQENHQFARDLIFLTFPEIEPEIF